MQTHIHVHINLLTHVCKHSHTRTKHTCKNTHKCTSTHSRRHDHTHTRTHAGASQTCTHMQCTCARTHTPTRPESVQPGHHLSNNPKGDSPLVSKLKKSFAQVIHRYSHLISFDDPSIQTWKCRQPGTGAWLRGAEERLLLETKSLHTKKGKKIKISGVITISIVWVGVLI